MNTFDVERFIELIKERPSLWDNHCDEYSNKIAKQLCWNEVFCEMDKSFDNLKPEEKNKKSAEMQRKWKSLRNCFTRELSKQKNTKTGDGASSRKTYIYFDSLCFLKPSLHKNGTSLSYEPETEETEREANTHQNSGNTRENALPRSRSGKRKHNVDESEDHLDFLHDTLRLRESMQLGLRNDEEDDDKLFLLSLHTHLKSISDDKKILAKSELIQVLLKYSEYRMSTSPLPFPFQPPYPPYPHPYNLYTKGLYSQPVNHGHTSKHIPSRQYSERCHFQTSEHSSNKQNEYHSHRTTANSNTIHSPINSLTGSEDSIISLFNNDA